MMVIYRSLNVAWFVSSYLIWRLREPEAQGGQCHLCAWFRAVVRSETRFEESLCARCARGSRCLSCGGIVGGTGSREACRTQDGGTQCRRCFSTRVDTAEDLVTVVPSVRKVLHGYGVSLPNRVSVQLVAPDVLSHRGVGVQGFCSLVGSGDSAVVGSIKIVRGLPATRFGAVLAHEMAHGWLALIGADLSGRLEEGLCELVASWWLRRRRRGYRMAVQRTAGMTPSAVVQRMTAEGAQFIEPE